MFAKRLAALLSVGLLAGLLMTADLGSNLSAQDKKDPPAKKEDTKKKDETPKKGDVKKKDMPKDKDDGDDEILPKIEGTTVKVIKVDKEKMTFEGESKGKKTTYTVGEEVKFFGPRGGKAEGFEDDRFAAGRKIKLVMTGAKIKEIHFDNRPKKDKKPDPKKD